MGCQFLDQGSNLCPLQWGCRVLTSGPPSPGGRGSSWGCSGYPCSRCSPGTLRVGCPFQSLPAPPAHKSRLSADGSTSIRLNSTPFTQPPAGRLRLNASQHFKCSKRKESSRFPARCPPAAVLACLHPWEVVPWCTRTPAASRRSSRSRRGLSLPRPPSGQSSVLRPCSVQTEHACLHTRPVPLPPVCSVHTEHAHLHTRPAPPTPRVLRWNMPACIHTPRPSPHAVSPAERIHALSIPARSSSWRGACPGG